MTTFNATYSPEDNKLRLYASEKLDDELYQRAKKLGFKWAPKQELFVAPMWTPQRKNFLLSLVDQIEDEQLTLEERAAERAARFENYKDKRKQDSENYSKQAQGLADQVPMGQPILVGHHSEKRARKHAEKIDRAMEKAVKNWDHAEYWEHRAQRTIRHANYKDQTGVRLRRIKKLEAEARKFQREIDQSEKFKSLWNKAVLTYENVQKIADYHRVYVSNGVSLWSALDKKDIEPEEAKKLALASCERTINHYRQWLDHTTLRINYEKSILKAQGYVEPVKEKRKLPPIVNYKGEGFVCITKAQWSAIHRDY
jgi:hypothetical protein